MSIRKVLGGATAFIVSSALVIGTAGTATAATPVISEKASDSSVSAGQRQQIEELLLAIDQIPDEVLLQGDKKTREWVTNNLGDSSVKVGGLTVSQPASLWSCSSAIVTMLAGNFIGVAKLMRIKAYMKSLGSVKEAIQLMWGASFNFEKMKALGGALGALAAELSGIALIQKSCP